MPTNRVKRHVVHTRSRSGREISAAKKSRSSGLPSRVGGDPKQPAREHKRPEDDLPFLQHRGYDGRELARALRKNAKASKISAFTSKQLEMFRDRTGGELTSSSLSHYLNEFMVTIDNAFFFGAVRPILKGIVVYAERTTKVGFYREKDQTIHMNRTFFARSGDFPHRQYLETLTHEMLHAFLDHYTCRCRRCKQKVGNAGILGASGHGPVWANAMVGIQEAMSRHLDWEVDCSIEASVMNEMKASGWEPKHEQILRWGCKYLAEKYQVTPASPSNNERSENRSESSRHNGCCAVM